MKNDAMCPIERYYKGWNERNVEEMAAALHPSFRFHGPMEQHDSPASFLESCRKMLGNPAMRDSTVKESARLVDGEKVAILYEWTSGDSKKTLPMAEFFSVKDGKIAEIRLYFDTAKMAI